MLHPTVLDDVGPTCQTDDPTVLDDVGSTCCIQQYWMMLDQYIASSSIG